MKIKSLIKNIEANQEFMELTDQNFSNCFSKECFVEWEMRITLMMK